MSVGGGGEELMRGWVSDGIGAPIIAENIYTRASTILCNQQTVKVIAVVSDEALV